MLKRCRVVIWRLKNAVPNLFWKTFVIYKTPALERDAETSSA